MMETEGRKIFGIKGLMKFLDCSETTAHRIVKTKVFPKYAAPKSRKFFFIESEILEGMRGAKS